MQLFQTARGRWFPVERIKTISAPRTLGSEATRETCKVELTDDESIEMFDFDVERLTRTPVQLLPAEQGTFYLYPGDTKDEEVFRTTIIAWALCIDGEVRPVTADGVDDNHTSNAETVLLPDGRVHVFEQEFANEQEWLDWKFKDGPAR